MNAEFLMSVSEGSATAYLMSVWGRTWLMMDGVTNGRIALRRFKALKAWADQMGIGPIHAVSRAPRLVEWIGFVDTGERAGTQKVYVYAE
ncbi:MAG: hypothetical protein AAGJ85_01410 [Pseudomonadota bacterium]